MLTQQLTRGMAAVFPLLPQVEADLSAAIPLLAETGPLTVQLSCLARRALPSVDPWPEVCLNGRAGGVMLAATGRRSITISNAGALAVAYDVKVQWGTPTRLKKQKACLLLRWIIICL
jgi:hypothetical protein